MPLNPVQDVQPSIIETLDGTSLGQELKELLEDVDRRQDLRLEEWFERVAMWTQGLCNDARHGGEFCELMNRLPRYMEHGEAARRAYDHLVNQLIMGYEAIRRTASEEANVLSGALGTNEYIVQNPDSFLPHVNDSISVISYAEHAIATIELNLMQPLKALDETPFRVESEEPRDPLFRCMVYLLSKARDILCDNMIRIGANRHSRSLYSSLQGREPYSGWSAAIEVFDKSITLSLYRGWTWLGLNAVAFGATETCALDMLPQETRNNLRELLRRPNVYERLPYLNGIVEALTFLRKFLTPEPEPSSSLNARIVIQETQVLCDGEYTEITRGKSREVLENLLSFDKGHTVVFRDLLSIQENRFTAEQPLKDAVCDLNRKLTRFGIAIRNVQGTGYKLIDKSHK